MDITMLNKMSLRTLIVVFVYIKLTLNHLGYLSYTLYKIAISFMLSSLSSNRGGVVLTLSVVDRGFEPQSG